MAVHCVVQGEANEMESFLGWEPAGPLPNAPCLGPLGARLLDCRHAWLQQNMLMCLSVVMGCKWAVKWNSR